MKMKGEKFLILGNDKKMFACCNRLKDIGYTAEMYDNGKKIIDFDNIILPQLQRIANRFSGGKRFWQIANVC